MNQQHETSNERHKTTSSKLDSIIMSRFNRWILLHNAYLKEKRRRGWFCFRQHKVFLIVCTDSKVALMTMRTSTAPTTRNHPWPTQSIQENQPASTCDLTNPNSTRTYSWPDFEKLLCQHELVRSVNEHLALTLKQLKWTWNQQWWETEASQTRGRLNFELIM